MQEISKELRLQFYAETNFELKEKSKNWQTYSKWLEQLSFQKINSELIMENKKLQKAFDKAINILDSGLINRI